MGSLMATVIRIGAVLLIVGLAAWLIRRAGAGLRDALRERKGPPGAAITPEQLDAITRHGLATAEQLFAMSPKEQVMLATTAMLLQAKGAPRDS